MKRKTRNTINGMELRPYIWMIGAAICVGALLCFLVSLCIYNEYIDITVAKKSAFIIQIISAAAGSAIAFGMIEKGRWLAYVICILLPIAVLSVISSLVFALDFSAVGWGSLSLIFGGLAGYYLAHRKNNRKTRRNKRYLKR